MAAEARIGIVGDRDAGFPPHLATEAAVVHAAESLGFGAAPEWVPTSRVGGDPAGVLAVYDGLWVAPGSPYLSLDGALAAIRHARESGVPLLGTCGGFQHVVLEYARNVLGWQDAAHAEYDPYASRLFVVPLSCSLVGRSMPVTIAPDSRAARFYGATGATEEYYCDFGLNPAHQDALDAGGLRIVGRDADGEARIVELPDHPYFVGTLFVPQMRSGPGRPHPLIVAFLRAGMDAS